VQDELVMAGNGTIGLELLEDLPDVDTVLVPVRRRRALVRDRERGEGAPPGRHGLRRRPGDRAALGARVRGRRAGRSSTPVVRRRLGLAACSDRCGRTCARRSTAPSSSRSTRRPRRAAARRAVRVIAEGAGALAPAVALSGRAGGGKIACIVSGGNIDFSVLAAILAARRRVGFGHARGRRPFPVEKLSVQPRGPAVVYFYPAALTPAARWRRRRSTTATTRSGGRVRGDRRQRRPSEKNDEFRRVRTRVPARLRRGAALTTDSTAQGVRRLRLVRRARHVPPRRGRRRPAGLGRRGRGAHPRKCSRPSDMSVEPVRARTRPSPATTSTARSR
jgi:hypothetical protein